jgi:hypothetical protein
VNLRALAGMHTVFVLPENGLAVDLANDVGSGAALPLRNSTGHRGLSELSQPAFKRGARKSSVHGHGGPHQKNTAMSAVTTRLAS